MKQILATIYTGVFLLLLAANLGGCARFDEMNTNPNVPESMTPAMLATGLIMDLTEFTGGGKTFCNPGMMSKHVAWGELMTSIQYNYVDRTGFGGYVTLTNATKMREMASGIDEAAYTGLALFVKAYKLFYVSMDLGDIPYSDAIMGEEGNMSPRYDTQKEVMAGVLADLAEADRAFGEATVNFDGDPLFGGNVKLWQKFVNSFRLKVLMYLSAKTSDTDLNIASTFASVAGRPLLESNSDNMQLVYSNKAGQLYPFNVAVNNFYYYPIVTSTIIDILKELGDYRLFYYANPSEYSTGTLGLGADEWDAYPGVDPSADFAAVVSAAFTDGRHCGFNTRYTNYEPGEPLMRLGFAEQNFIMAEAAVRGWINGSASDYYSAGIRAAMRFVVDHTPAGDTYHHGRPITDDYIDGYVADARVALSANQEDALKQIWTQKYILYFLQHPWDSYYEHRRTNYPVWPVNPATNLNTENPSGIPTRWMYPQNEYNVNMTNLKEALDRQYGGLDRVNDLMWLLK